jgi:GNAT superfamily N-acetyltransferase
MTVVIRFLQAGDVSAVADAFIAWNKPREQYDRYFAECQRGIRVMLVAFVDGHVAGYGNLLWRSDYEPFIAADIPEINDLNTLEPYRRRGIATAIIRQCEDIAVARGRPVIGIGVGMTPDYDNARRLYPKLGYEYDGRGIRSTIWGGVQYLTRRLTL